MRIALVTETFVPSTDGVVTRLTKAVSHLKRAGHEVVVIAPDLGETEYDGVPIRGIRAVKLPFYRFRPFSLPTPDIEIALKEIQPDVVHAANPLLLAASGAKYAKRQGIPLVCSYHTHIPKYLDYYKIFKPLKPLLWAFIVHQHKRAQVNLCTSHAIREELTSHGVESLHVLPRGVDTERRNPKYRSQEMRALLSKGHPHRKLLVFIGRLAIEKEIDRLLPLVQTREDIRLAIVGDGPDRGRLEKLFLGTDTVFTGFLHGDALSQAFASADAFVFPSVSETLGLVILESMASGVPVIAAKSEPTLEQIRHLENGLLFNVEEYDSLPAAVDLLYDEALYSKIRTRGLQEALDQSWESASEAMESAYHLAIARSALADSKVSLRNRLKRYWFGEWV